MAGRPSNGPSKGLTFFGMVGATMAALKLKEQWDDYRRIPSEEDGHGPVALQSPTDEESLGMLDTEIPVARPKRQKRDCCMCCGMRCGLFWKAFGIVCLLLVGWNAIKFAIWLATPSPTGLEGMPEFSKSLGCASAPHLYQDSAQTFMVPLTASDADHILDISGSAVGTLVVTQGYANATEVKYDVTVRSESSTLLESVSLQYPTADTIESGPRQSQVVLKTPLSGLSPCMRFDMTVYVPPNLKQLYIRARHGSQIKFDDESNFDLDVLNVKIDGLDEQSMILPHKGVHAGSINMEMDNGWLVGDVAIVDKTTLTTQRGAAVLNVHVYPVPSALELPAVAQLQTTTGAGRSDVFYVNHPGHLHRPISSTHRSQRNGDLYLTYKEAEFNGTVDMSAKSSTTVGLQGMIHKSSGQLPWVGDKDGGDSIQVTAPNGWVGIYF